MKRILLMPLLLLAFTLSACGPDTKVGGFLTAVTTTITNPVDAVDIYRVKNVYAASLELAVKYREYCWSKPFAELMADPASKVVCKKRRAAVRAMQAAQINASAAIHEAEEFVRNYPTLNAAKALGAAWSAVQGFKATVGG